MVNFQIFFSSNFFVDYFLSTHCVPQCFHWCSEATECPYYSLDMNIVIILLYFSTFLYGIKTIMFLRNHSLKVTHKNPIYCPGNSMDTHPKWIQYIYNLYCINSFLYNTKCILLRSLNLFIMIPCNFFLGLGIPGLV